MKLLNWKLLPLNTLQSDKDNRATLLLPRLKDLTRYFLLSFLCLFLLTYHIKIIQDNTEFENLDVGFKCCIPELSGFKWVTIAWSSTQVSSMLFELIMRFSLKDEDEEIIEKRGIYNEIEKFYFNKINQ